MSEGTFKWRETFSLVTFFFPENVMSFHYCMTILHMWAVSDAVERRGSQQTVNDLCCHAWNVKSSRSVHRDKERSALRFRGLDTLLSPMRVFTSSFSSSSLCLSETLASHQRWALTNIYSVIHFIFLHLSLYLFHSQRKWELMLVMSLEYSPDRQAPQ